MRCTQGVLASPSHKTKFEGVLSAAGQAQGGPGIVWRRSPGRGRQRGGDRADDDILTHSCRHESLLSLAGGVAACSLDATGALSAPRGFQFNDVVARRCPASASASRCCRAAAAGASPPAPRPSASGRKRAAAVEQTAKVGRSLAALRLVGSIMTVQMTVFRLQWPVIQLASIRVVSR